MCVCMSTTSGDSCAIMSVRRGVVVSTCVWVLEEVQLFAGAGPEDFDIEPTSPSNRKASFLIIADGCITHLPTSVSVSWTQCCQTRSTQSINNSMWIICGIGLDRFPALKANTYLKGK